MTTHQYISVRETAQILGVSEKKVMDLVEEKKLQAYRIADQFLRLKKSEVLEIKNAGQVAADSVPQAYTAAEKMADFFYFNDFYLISGVVIVLLLCLILNT